MRRTIRSYTQFFVVGLSCVLWTLVQGCSGDRLRPIPDGPVVYSIGSSPLLTFEPKGAATFREPSTLRDANSGVLALTEDGSAKPRVLLPDAIYISIEGRDLANPRFDSRVSVSGTVEPIRGFDYDVLYISGSKSDPSSVPTPQPPAPAPAGVAPHGSSSNPATPAPAPISRPAVSTIVVELRRSYLDRLKTKDRLRIDYFAQERPDAAKARESDARAARREDMSFPTAEPARVIHAERAFSLYEVQDYRRDVLARLVPLHNISAFPLPEKEVEFMFGNKIRRHFFVVRLSIRNTAGKDQLVTTSMIKASGTALVETLNNPPLHFAVPVEASPQSQSHVFTMLSDEEVTEFRSVFFRNLEFAGALTSGIFGVVDASKLAIQGLNVATAMGIPGLKTVWTDRYPGYKRNIVDYGMPDLVKIPNNGVSAHRYLFFSKSKLQNLIIDQSLAGTRNTDFTSAFAEEGYDQPPVHVVQMAFDNLEIPYEETLPQTEEKARGDLQLADDQLKLVRSALATLSSFWFDEKKPSADRKLFDRLTRDHLKALKDISSDWPSPADLNSILATFEDHLVQTSLFLDPSFNSAQLEQYQAALDRARVELSRGNLPPDLVDSLAAMVASLKRALAIINYYRDASDALSVIAPQVSALPPTDPQRKEQIAKLASSSQTTLATLAGRAKAIAPEPPAPAKPSNTAPPAPIPPKPAHTTSQRIQYLQADLAPLGDLSQFDQWLTGTAQAALSNLTLTQLRSVRQAAQNAAKLQPGNSLPAAEHAVLVCEQLEPARMRAILQGLGFSTPAKSLQSMSDQLTRLSTLFSNSEVVGAALGDLETLERLVPPLMEKLRQFGEMAKVISNVAQQLSPSKPPAEAFITHADALEAFASVSAPPTPRDKEVGPGSVSPAPPETPEEHK